MTDAKGQTVTNTYDAFNQLIGTVDAAGITNTFGHDKLGNRTRVTDGKGQTTEFEFDGASRLIAQRFANGDQKTFAYRGNDKISEVDPLGRTTLFGMNAAHQPLRVSQSGSNRDFTYHATTGLLTKVSDPNQANTASGVVEYTYDTLGRVTAEKSHNVTHKYTYDAAGNRISVHYGDNRKVMVTFDALNRPIRFVDDRATPSIGDDQITEYRYDLAGQAVTLLHPNGQVSRNTYDELGRLILRVLYKPTANFAESDVLAKFTYTHDELGNVLTQTERWTSSGTQPARNRLTTLGYDAANRLVSESIQEAGEAAILTTYAYDAANNRTSKSVTAGAGTVPSGVELGVWSYLYNNANQLTQMEKRLGEGQPVVAQVNYSYDANGNRISRVPAVIPATTASNTAAEIAKRTTTYGWDMFDRLLTVSQPVAGSTVKQTFNYSYDYRTRRTMVHQVAQGTVPVKYTAVVFSGGVSVAEYEKTVTTAPVGAGTTAATKAHVEYMRGPDMGGGVGGLLATFRNPVSTTNVVVAATVTNPIVARHNLSNGRGDIVAQSDANATLTWTASYEAYGKRTKETGQNKDKQRANTKDEDPTGLLNEGHRYRDIETGGWLSRDPAGFVDGPNLYAYVKQNPWTGFDPLGLWEAVPVPVNAPFMQKMALTWENAKRGFSSLPRELSSGFAKVMENKAAATTFAVSNAPMVAVAGYQAVTAMLANPTLTYNAVEAVSTGVEIATDYEGPSLPGPGDLVKVALKNIGPETAKTALEKAKNIVYGELSEADRKSLDEGGGLVPKGTGGTILDHVRGQPTGHISAAESVEGTSRFKGGNGLAGIDVDAAQAGGAKYISHDEVIGGVGARPKQVQKVQESREVLFEGTIPREAVEIIEPK